jgi:hypothetical protein
LKAGFHLLEYPLLALVKAAKAGIAVEITEENGKQADSQDVCNMIDEMQKII